MDPIFGAYGVMPGLLASRALTARLASTTACQPAVKDALLPCILRHWYKATAMIDPDFYT